MDRITAIIKNAIRLHYYPRTWKWAQGILLEKNTKQDKSLVKFYRVISLLNYINKLLEKVVAKELSLFCKANLKLHKGQIGVLKKRRIINTTTIMIENMYKS